MEIIKNTAYLRFIKYEHWLAFAGVAVIILQIFLKIFNVASSDNILISFLFVLNILPVLLNSPSFHLPVQSRFIAILLLFLPLTCFYFNKISYIGWAITSEIFWRSTYFEIIKRQGFSNSTVVIITTIASACFYFLLFPSIHISFALIFFGIIVIAGILRSKGDITTVFSFYSILIVLSFFLLAFFFPNSHD
jgi:hypothetical protein